MYEVFHLCTVCYVTVMLTCVMVVYYKLRVSKKIQTQACNKGQTLPQVCLYHLENQRIREELCVR
jgi:hypothetical protein